MTTLRVWQDSAKKIKAFECYGHAGYSKLGKDIVCSAVSILTINTLNSIESMCEDKMNVDTDEKSGLIRCTFIGEISHDAELLVRSMINGMSHIQKEYGNKYIEIIFEEV